MPHRALALLPTALIIGWACTTPTSAPEAPTPASSACADPLYLELRGEQPDSLSEREWERLQQMESACQIERTRATEGVSVDRDRHLEMWIWMPAMMAVGGLMWLMMGG